MTQTESSFQIDVNYAFGPVLAYLCAGIKNSQDVQVSYDGLPTSTWSGITPAGRFQGPTQEIARARGQCLQFYGTHASAPASLVLSTLVPLVAAKFSLYMRELVGVDNFREITRLNAKESAPNICHTHDYCDANMVMADAISHSTGVCPTAEGLIDDPVLMQLWNSSWDVAKATFMTQPGLDDASQVCAEVSLCGRIPVNVADALAKGDTLEAMQSEPLIDAPAS